MSEPQTSKQEQIQIQEATTGLIAQPRSMEPVDPSTLDPRFDVDDLRQGHPPPAAKKHLKMIKVKRNRKNKGTPYDPKEATNQAEIEREADLTEEEVEISDDLPQDPSSSEEKKTGLLGKILGNDKESEKE